MSAPRELGGRSEPAINRERNSESVAVTGACDAPRAVRRRGTRRCAPLATSERAVFRIAGEIGLAR